MWSDARINYMSCNRMQVILPALQGHRHLDYEQKGFCSQPSLNMDKQTRISGHWCLRAVWITLLRHGYPDIGYSDWRLYGQPWLDTNIRTLVTQGYVDNPLWARIFGHWVHRAMWTAPCGHGYPDIGYSDSGLCGQPSSGTDIRTLGTQGYVDSPLWTRISRYWSLRAMWKTLCGHRYPDIGLSGLSGQRKDK